MTNTRCFSLLLALLLASAGNAQRLQPSDLAYEGVIAPPRYLGQVPSYSHGMWGLEYDPTCAGQPDPSPADGYPGCLAAGTHKDFDQFGMFDIVAPSMTHGGDYNLVPQGREVVDFFKCSLRSDGSDIQAEAAVEGKIKPRDIPGIVRTPSGRWICTCVHDWYNVSERDYDSHCWFDFVPEKPNARGPYGWGKANDPDFHAQRMAWYLGLVPQAWANAHLEAAGKPYCFTGMHRKGGKAHWSPGPAIYAFPCEEPTEPERTQLMNARELLGWHGRFPLSAYDKPHPEWSAITQTHGVIWIDETLIAAVTRGGDYWWYGQPNPYDTTKGPSHRNTCDFDYGDPEKCFTKYGPMLPPGTQDKCSSYKGYHAVLDPDGSGGPQWAWQLQFYSAGEIAEVAAGDRNPADILPYATHTGVSEAWDKNCGTVGDVAYDVVHRRLYVAEQHAAGANSVIHVYQVGKGQPILPRGDGNCDPNEDVCNCSKDCGQPPTENCADGIDNDCDGLADCVDEDCVTEPACAPPSSRPATSLTH